MTLARLQSQLQTTFQDQLLSCQVAFHEITVVIAREALLTVATQLRDLEPFQFNQLIDVCGVDYSQYGQAEWETQEANLTGYDRAVSREQKIQVEPNPHPERFAAVYHLLSLPHNQRLRLKVYVPENDLCLPSVTPIWNAANWFEREAFDLFGLLFEGHPDLRRILTDYGFRGHPFRKDFPLMGHVEMRYDATEQRVLYEPVTIQPRTLYPRVIRHTTREPLNHPQDQQR